MRKFVSDQKPDLKPWLRCDGSGKYSYIEISVKGARHNNEDAAYADGKLFCVFDGHGGKHASTLLKTKLAEMFYDSVKDVSEEAALVRGTPPKVVSAIDSAFTRSQEAMPSEMPSAHSGSTAVCCWVHGQSPSHVTVFASCLGDSKALLFNSETGAIPSMAMRTWDAETCTLAGEGVESVARAETNCHNLTGALVLGRDGVPASMDKDPTGVGFREYKLLRERHKFAASRRPYNISNMPGEERWRVLDVEPTRALGHKLKREQPLQHPEIHQWRVQNPEQDLLMISCDGFFSKEAFQTPDRVTKFLTDPEGYCADPSLFQGTCLLALLQRLKEAHTLPDPRNVTMAQLFDKIRDVVFGKLSDDTWTSAYDSAYQYLKQFAREKPVPNIRTHPAKTLLAACYLAVLMVSDDNVSVSLVFLDGQKRFNGQRIEIGECP